MTQYRVLPYSGAEPRQISEVVNNAMGGKINATGTINLNANSATATSIIDSRLGAESVVLFMPTNTASATFMNDMFVTEKTDGSATITHSINTAASATFSYLVIG
tara:strand:- start:604 stop:918 length:315 start_codon:yes stop_codon:yes gene_type:complete